MTNQGDFFVAGRPSEPTTGGLTPYTDGLSLRLRNHSEGNAARCLFSAQGSGRRLETLRLIQRSTIFAKKGTTALEVHA